MIDGVHRIVNHFVNHRTRHHRSRLAVVLILQNYVVIVACVYQFLHVRPEYEYWSLNVNDSFAQITFLKVLCHLNELIKSSLTIVKSFLITVQRRQNKKLDELKEKAQ